MAQKEVKILNDKEIDIIWKSLDKSTISKSIPYIKTKVPIDLLSQYNFDVAKCYKIYTSNLKDNKLHVFLLKRIKNLIQDIDNLYYEWSVYNEYTLEFDEKPYAKVNAGNTSMNENSIINRLTLALINHIKAGEYFLCINKIIITVNTFKELKTNNYHILRKLAILISPFLPYTAERVWATLLLPSFANNLKKTSIFIEKYPEVDNFFVKKNHTLYPVYIDGKRKFEFEAYNYITDQMIIDELTGSLSLTRYLDGKLIDKLDFHKDKYFIIKTHEYQSQDI